MVENQVASHANISPPSLHMPTTLMRPIRPLSGIKVIEFCQVLAGPFCGCLLADMGADVIKVEPPDGDLMRAWPPMVDGYSQYFASVNRNKRSVVLDLKTPDGLAGARKLALSGDVVIENFRPGVMAKFGLDHASLAEEKPSLVYCSVSAYGQTGPRAKEGKQGEGDFIDVSMLGSMLGIANLQTSELFGTGRDPVRLGSAHPMNAPYAGFRCRDGDIALAAGTNKLWEAACVGIGRTDLTQDVRFATPSLRAKHQNELRDLLELTFANFDSAQLLKIFRERGVPCAPINTYSEILADPQVEHMQWVEPITLPGNTASKTMISPQRVSGKSLGVYRNPPALGAHTQEVLHEISLK